MPSGSQLETKAPSKPSFAIQFEGTVIASIMMGSFIHPIETATKRWQKASLTLQESRNSTELFNRAMYQHAHDKCSGARVASFYSGISYGITYKISVMSYLMLTQKYVAQQIQSGPMNFYFRNIFGEKYSDIAANTTAGAIVGAGETLFLPLNTLKTQYMTNPVVRQKIDTLGLIQYYRQLEKICFYKVGWLTTLKNITGVGTYFGLDAAAKYFLQAKEPSTLQIILASMTGAVGYIAITNPFEVIKVRAQAVEGPVSVRDIFSKTLNDEGYMAFFRGTSLRLVAKGSKLIMTFSAAGILMNKLAEKPLSSRLYSFFKPERQLSAGIDDPQPMRLLRR